jgi:hypothetical protein
MKVADTAVGSGALGLTGNYVELQGVASPSNPTSGFGRLFLNSANGEVSVKKPSGSIVSLEGGEGGGGSGDFLGNFASPTELTLSSGTVAFPGSGAYALDTESDAAADNWTGATCPAGASFSIQAASDARTVVIVSTSIPTPSGGDLSFDQDGDLALVVCQTADAPEVIVFVDENGQTTYRVDGGDSGSAATIRPPGFTSIQISRHADNCQALTDGLDGEMCRQVDTNAIYFCDTSDGVCDSAAEWEIYSAPESISWAISDPTTADSANLQWLAPRTATIVQVDCSTDTGTVTLQLDERAKTTPNSAGADVMTAQLVCDSDNETTVDFDNAGIAAGALLNLDIDAVASSPTKVRIHIEYSIN